MSSHAVIALIGAYLLGSISFAVVVSRAMGLADPRSYGSGNPGATNVLRTGRRGAALLTLLGDSLKGVVAVLVARSLGVDEAFVVGAALAAFIGHVFPVFHSFKGGKGVATAAGVLIALDPWLGGPTLLTWVLIAFFFRYSSLAALVASVFAPFWQVFLHGPGLTALAVAVMSAVLIARHRGNIVKLMNGTESRIGGGSRASSDQSQA